VQDAFQWRKLEQDVRAELAELQATSKKTRTKDVEQHIKVSRHGSSACGHHHRWQQGGQPDDDDDRMREALAVVSDQLRMAGDACKLLCAPACRIDPTWLVDPTWLTPQG
jgi:hypothetical protein